MMTHEGLLNGLKQVYEIFQKEKYVMWAGEDIDTEEKLLEKFREVLSEEEINNIIKGVE